MLASPTQLEQWLNENDLTAYIENFKESVDNLNDLSDNLQDDESIKAFIKNDIGETKIIKLNKIFQAIKTLQERQMITQHPFDLNSIINVKEETQIEEIYRNDYNNKIRQVEKRYYEINVTDAMTKLANCGGLIQLAYASSNGFSCQGQIVELLSKYSTLVKDSYIASAKFVITSINSCQYHKLALQISNKAPNESIVLISKCSKLAETMAEVANDLVIKSRQLTEIAQTALKTAVSDKSITDSERNEINKKMEEAKSKSIEIETMTAGLAQQVQELKLQQEEAAKQAEQERSRRFVLAVIKSITIPISTPLTSLASALSNKNSRNNNDCEAKIIEDNNSSEAKTIEDKEYLLMNQKYQVQNKLIEQNAELAKTLSELTNFKQNNNQLGRALKSIEIVIKTLGKIQVIFSNTKLFWEGVKENCNQLVKQNDMMDVLAQGSNKFIKEIQNVIAESALNWFVLCKVNYFAKKAIIQVDKNMDKILNDLPNENESIRLIDKLTLEMKVALQEENKAIESCNQQEFEQQK